MVHTIPLRPSLLLDLPLELITATLCFLDAHALLECSLVNTTLHSLIATTPELQYTLALFSDGLTDSPSPLCTIPARERLCLLRARRRAWRSLAFTQKDPVRLRGECAAYELVGGVFAKAGRLRPGNMLSDPRGPSLSMCWLPDSSNPVRIVERDDVGVQARDFAMDPSQDLLVLVELPDSMVPVVHVHLRTLSTNGLHPSAKLHTLVHVTRTLVDSAVVQIAGDVIAFFWSSLDSPGLVIWNWMTGEALVTAISATPLSIGQAWDFDFLSPRSFILVNLGHVGAAGSLSLFSIEEAPYSKPTHEPRTARFVARLHLPTLTPGTRMANISVHSGPHPGGLPAPHLPFSFTDGTQMHVISVDYFREQDVLHHRFSLFVRNRTLQSFIYASPITHNENGEGPVDVPWEVWGPANTRFMPQYAPFGWLRYTYGARVCLPPIVIQDGPVPSIVLRVLDFGVRPALWNNRYQEHRKGVLGSEEYEHEGCDGERSSVTTLFTMGCEDPERKFFVNPVCTSLPCVIVERQEEEWRYTAFMMDDQRLIGMKTNPFTLGDMKDLDVFVL